MSYNPATVLLYPGIPTTTSIRRGNSTAGFPTSFNYFLLSLWVCLGKDTINRGISFGNLVPFGTISINTVDVHVFLGGELYPDLYDGTFNFPSYSTYRSNLLVSIDAPNQIIQVYVNDAPLVLSSGGWLTPGRPFDLAGPICQWEISGAGSGLPGAGLGDVYSTAPDTFYDLNDVGNRRKFINADLVPVDLGNTADGPTGDQPYIWLSSRNGLPSDIATNYGTGGVFEIVGSPPDLIYQAAGSCDIPPIPTRDLKLISLYPIASPNDLYGLSSLDADFPTSFSQFSLSLWCCKSVNISSPGLQMAFTPSTISITTKDASDNTLFAGSWHNPGKSIDEYQVLFSLDTIAQTYTLYVSNLLWIVESVDFPNSGEIDNS